MSTGVVLYSIDHEISVDVMTFVSAAGVDAPDTWVNLLFSPTAILLRFFSTFSLMQISSSKYMFIAKT